MFCLFAQRGGGGALSKSLQHHLLLSQIIFSSPTLLDWCSRNMPYVWDHALHLPQLLYEWCRAYSVCIILKCSYSCEC